MTPRQQALAEARNFCGFRRASFARSTGTLVVLVESAEQGCDPDLPWTLICEQHNAIMQFETQANAISWMPVPQDWCEACQEIHYGASQYGSG